LGTGIGFSLDLDLTLDSESSADSIKSPQVSSLPSLSSRCIREFSGPSSASLGLGMTQGELTTRFPCSGESLRPSPCISFLAEPEEFTFFRQDEEKLLFPIFEFLLHF
jgi:hypothetical protein